MTSRYLVASTVGSVAGGTGHGGGCGGSGPDMEAAAVVGAPDT